MNRSEDCAGWHLASEVAPDKKIDVAIATSNCFPGLFRTMLAGQSVCGYDVWTCTCNLAFGDN